MNIKECQREAKEKGWDCLLFDAIFPDGVKECQWIDAYIGIFKIKDSNKSFHSVAEIKKHYPELMCLNLRVK
jgi:hypothetical protein